MPIGRTLCAAALLALVGSAAQALEGAYELNGVIMSFNDEGVLETSARSSDSAAQSSYKIEGDRLTVTSSPDDATCPGAVGVYAFKESDTGVRFRLIKDSCQERADALTAGLWKIAAD
jgi:hypothetical protein